MALRPGPITLEHEIFVIDAGLEDALPAVGYEPLVRALSRDLLRTLGMLELGPLCLYPALDLRAPGWSFIQPITTSHISGHYFEKPGPAPHIHIDIYSCKGFAWRNVIDVLDTHLHLADWRANFIRREMTVAERTCLDISGRGAEILTEQDVKDARKQQIPSLVSA